ncbi:MAG TPA: thioredoxin domain-containing protein [Nitrospira sp.]|jgi:thioredoxin-like negative regulator of GroEL|nr:thioredoxin domain-containing protein [Nitrospira sp.]
MIADVSDRDFDHIVERSTVPVLVLFWKPGCGGCRALTRQLERLVAEVGGTFAVLKMNVEDNFQIPSELEITALPALALYRGGQFERFIGGLGTKEEILKRLQPIEGPVTEVSKSGRPAE